MSVSFLCRSLFAALLGAGSGVSPALAASQAFSTRTCRLGTASLITSLALPAARSATARARATTSWVNTGAVDDASLVDHYVRLAKDRAS